MKNTLVFLFIFIYAASYSWAFFDRDMHVLNMQNGLADNNVSTIYKDRDGFMWFGTTNGLSRYDGLSIKNFTIENMNLNVADIKEVSPNCLGILADGRLHCFNRRTERFIPILVDSKVVQVIQASGILPDNSNNCWVISGGSLINYQLSSIEDKEKRTIGINLCTKKEFSQLVTSPERFSKFTKINGGQDICLVTNQAKLLFFSPQSPQTVQTVQLSDGQPVTINDISVSDSIVWVSTIMQGVLCYHLRSGRREVINYKGPEKENRLSHTDAFQVIKINSRSYMAVTWSGYTLITLGKEKPEEITTELYNNTASQLYRNMETRMRAVYYDPNGIIWVGTNGGGVIYTDLRSQFYNQYHQTRHNEICGIEIDSSNYLWIGTFHLGIMRSDEPFSTTSSLNFSQVGTEEVRAKETVLCTFKGEDGTIWFGNKDGTITSYNDKNCRFATHALVEKKNTNDSPVWALCMDRKQRFWVGTEKGLWLFNPRTGASQQIPIDTESTDNKRIIIRAINETADGSIWIGSVTHGLCRIGIQPDGSTKIQRGYEAKAQLQGIDIRSMLSTKDGYLYVGYTTGFAVVSTEKDCIEHFYTTKEGLCSNFIGSLMEDKKGQIWLGTNSGIARYSRHLHQFYNYYISGSNRSALFANGHLFWGNNKSLTYFKPGELEQHQSTNAVKITGLEINNHPVNIGEVLNGQTVLQKGVSFTDAIRLSNENRDFSVTFNNLSYSTNQQKYIYRLRPYQKEWQIGEYRRASFTNLPAGNYTLDVANVYPDGTNGKVTTLQIEIEPHWSHSFLFRLLLLLLFVTTLGYLWQRIKLRQKRINYEMQMKHELVVLNIEREKEHQIRLERENFFSGAAHELRTPLTLILSPLQELLKQTLPTSPIYSKLLTMYKNGSSLHTLVDHFLYLQKIEAGMVRLCLCEADVVELVKNIADSFREIAEIRGVCLELHNTAEKDHSLWIDAEKIGSAIRNLLSNAFKYTPKGGSIRIDIDRVNKNEKDFCRITVTDTGIGISAELKERIFDSFITGNTPPSVSTKVGIGLRIVKNTIDLHHGLVEVESTEGVGSTFRVFIPVGNSHFKSDSYETTTYHPQNNSFKEDTLLHNPMKQEAEESHETKKSLLIIEDNQGMRAYIKSLFIQQYRIIEALDGEEGVTKATNELPDCILSDVMMPLKDGFTCCREIREQQETAHIPILLLTAKAEDSDKLQGSWSGADDFVMKPFNPELLKAKVEQLIVQRERLKRIYTKALMLKQHAVSQEKEDAFMQKLINVIEVNLSHTEFNVKALAEQLNMSQPTLYRRMKQHSDMAVVDVIRSVRVSKAASLLMENRHSIQEISEIVGFGDARTLRKHFTEQFGVSPSKYMNREMQ